MKSLLLLSLCLAICGVWCDNFILGLGRREPEDQFLTRFTEKSEVFTTPQSVLSVGLERNLTGIHYTYLHFSTPGSHYNFSATQPMDKTFIRAGVFGRDMLSLQLDLTVYGYLYSPGPVYP